MKLKLRSLLCLLLFSAFSYLNAQITVNSLQELKPYLDDDNVNVTLTPGNYYVTGEDCENGLFGG